MQSTTLTKEQKKIVYSNEKIKQIVAGAGCGKTFTIIEAIAYYFKKGLLPEKLMLITFTRKAAAEMKERLQNKLKNSYSSIDLTKAKIGTFHSVCFSLLKKYFPAQIKNYKILDEEKSKEIKYTIAAKYKKDLLGLPLDILFRSEKLKKEFLYIKRNIENEYKLYKQKNGFLDFDELITLFIDLAKKSNILSTIQKEFSLIVVDEFQDSGYLEMEFLQLLKVKRLIVVGDDWQSIYGFRRANLSYIKNFNSYFKKSNQFFLTCNYRSSVNIINASAKSIHTCKGLISKKIKAHNKFGSKPVMFLIEQKSLYFNCLREISLCLQNRNTGHTVILSRTNRQSEEMNKIFTNTNLQFYNRNAVKKNKIEFMTIHQAKGLEFDNVIIAPIDNKSIPHPDGNIEEEMRLLYVACSRAKKNLLLLASSNKNKSPFLSFFRRTVKKIYLLDINKIGKSLDKNWGISSAG